MSLSGANNVPLGYGETALNKMCTGGGPSLLNPSYLHGPKRENESSDSDGGKTEKKRRRKSRWGGGEQEKAFIPGMPTIIPANMNKDQEEAYLLQLQIEEVTRRLRTGELGIYPNPDDRSPSPEPIYNHEGKRLNTREYRMRKKMEDERHSLITRMLQVNKEYKPPADYKPPIQRVSDKVMIPQEQNPDINFIGLLIGPRGNTLKSLEKETGAKIIIRGKGSVKEGKVGRKDGQPLPGEDEPLHAFITAQNPECVKKAVDKIKEIIRQGIEVPEGQNDLRKMQLRELALLNGTLRENDGPKCSNCGSIAHRSWQCPDKPNVTSNVICTACGGAGHIAKDCRIRKTGQDPTKIDQEYMSLMAELGEGPMPPGKRDEIKSPGGMDSRFAPRPGIFDPRPAPRAIMAATRQETPVGGPMGTMQQWEKPMSVAPPSQGTVFAASPNFSNSRPSLSIASSLGQPSSMFSRQASGITSNPGTGPSGFGPAGGPGSWQHQPLPSAQTPAQSQSQSNRYNMPPHAMMPSRSPPPSQQQWMSPPPWMGRPPPAGPPPRGSSAAPPWQGGGPSGAGVDINALAQAGLPNLLAAPPPPPPQ